MEWRIRRGGDGIENDDRLLYRYRFGCNWRVRWISRNMMMLSVDLGFSSQSHFTIMAVPIVCSSREPMLLAVIEAPRRVMTRLRQTARRAATGRLPRSRWPAQWPR